MGKGYYVILDKRNLNFMNNGMPASIDGADKFDSYESAKKELIEKDSRWRDKGTEVD